MCEHLGRCSVPGAYNTSAGSAEPLTSQPNERMKGGSRENWISRPPDLNRGNGKHQSDRNQATGRKLQVGQLDSRTGLGCLTDCRVTVVKGAYSGYCLRLIQNDFMNPKIGKIFSTRFSCFCSFQSNTASLLFVC